MKERIFVRVVGFSDVERHALNSVFRLSEERETVYSAWTSQAPSPARLVLVDGQGAEAAQEMAPPQGDGPHPHLFWVGTVAPAHAARTFQRPLHWPDVVQAMDEIFAPAPELDFDLEIGGPPPRDGGATRRVLIADGDAEARLYWRAKFAGLRFPEMDEAASAEQARSMAASGAYHVALVSFDLPGGAWGLAAELMGGSRPIPHVVLLTQDRSWPILLRARSAGLAACLRRPPRPEVMLRLLRKL